MVQNEQLGRKKRAQYAGIVAGVTPKLLRRARRLLRDDDEAWDLVQTTLERGYRSFDSFVDVPERDCRLTRAEAWLFTIMNNYFIDLTRLAWKRRRRMPVHLLESIAADPPSEGPPIWLDFTIADVRRASRRLPERLRRVFELFTFEKCSIREVAAQFGIPDGTVCSRLARARGRIKELLLEERRSALPYPISLRRRAEADEGSNVSPATEVAGHRPIAEGSDLVGSEIAAGRWIAQVAEHHRQPVVVGHQIVTGERRLNAGG